MSLALISVDFVQAILYYLLQPSSYFGEDTELPQRRVQSLRRGGRDSRGGHPPGWHPHFLDSEGSEAGK